MEYGKEEIKTGEGKKRGVARLLGCLIAPLFLICGLGYGWYFSRTPQSFPKLQVGTYIGEVTTLKEEKLPFVIESLVSGDVLVSLNEVQRVATVPAVENTKKAEFIYPLIINNQGMQLRLVGSEVGTGYAGKVYNQSDGFRFGSWTLSRVEASKVDSPAPGLEERLKAHLELSDILAKIKDGKEKIAAQQTEIDKLTRYITDEDLLRAKAEKKYNEISEKLEEIRKTFQGKLKEASEAETRLVLAQTVTPMGQLVSLARKTLERENRWIDSALSGVLPSNGEDFKVELDKAKKILGVKQAIAEEREYIKNLQMLQADQYPSQRPNSFGALWGGR